jgi:chromosome segregation ATPase
VSSVEELQQALDQARETNRQLHRRVQALEGPWQRKLQDKRLQLDILENRVKTADSKWVSFWRTLIEIERKTRGLDPLVHPIAAVVHEISRAKLKEEGSLR